MIAGCSQVLSPASIYDSSLVPSSACYLSCSRFVNIKTRAFVIARSFEIGSERIIQRTMRLACLNPDPAQLTDLYCHSGHAPSRAWPMCTLFWSARGSRFSIQALFHCHSNPLNVPRRAEPYCPSVIEISFPQIHDPLCFSLRSYG